MSSFSVVPGQEIQFSSPSQIQAARVTTSAQEILTFLEWTWMSFYKNSGGSITISTSSNPSSNGENGISVPGSTPVNLLMAPGTKLYAIGTSDSEILGFCQTNMAVIPLIVQLLAGVKGLAGEPFAATPEFKKWIINQPSNRGR